MRFLLKKNLDLTSFFFFQKKEGKFSKIGAELIFRIQQVCSLQKRAWQYHCPIHSAYPDAANLDSETVSLSRMQQILTQTLSLSPRRFSSMNQPSRITILWVLLISTLGFSLPSSATASPSDHHYNVGDHVPLFVNKVGPLNNPRFLSPNPFRISPLLSCCTVTT